MNSVHWNTTERPPQAGTTRTQCKGDRRPLVTKQCNKTLLTKLGNTSCTHGFSFFLFFFFSYCLAASLPSYRQNHAKVLKRKKFTHSFFFKKNKKIICFSVLKLITKIALVHSIDNTRKYRETPKEIVTLKKMRFFTTFRSM